jgi:PAS domain S-box-containing protein
VVVLHDISIRKNAEAALRAARDELEARVEERTTELTRLNRELLSEIDERVRAEEALRESEEKYRQLVKHAPAGIYEVDFVNLKFISVNDVMCQYTGYTREEFLALAPPDLLAEDSRELFAERFQKFLRGEPIPNTVEYKVKGKYNQEFWVLVHTRWMDDQGQPGRATVVVHDITERRRAEELVKTSLREKEILLQEIHHRVKNNLQIISSLLSLQSDYIDDPHALEVFWDSQHRIRSMALIHEKLYHSESLARVDFGEYLRDLATYLGRGYNASARGIALNVRVENVYLEINTAVPCGLILNELVSNSLKHAFLLGEGGSSDGDRLLEGDGPNGRAGEIGIELSQDQDGQVTLLVGDNGVGFPTGVDFRNTASLGLQLVNTLVAQLDGNIELDSSQDGAQFKITFSGPNL